MMGHIVGTPASALNGLITHHGDNLVCRLDPRSRIIVAVLFAIIVVALSDFVALGMALLLAAVVLVLARLPWGVTLRRLVLVDGFIVFMLIMLPFTTPGTTLFTLGPLTATQEGLLKALAIALKANAIIITLLALVGTTDATTLGHALYRLKVPENLVHLLLFTVRYIDVFQQEYLRLRTAMRARGFQPGNNGHNYRSIGYLIGMMLVRSLERSERILEAMKCRGFQGRFFIVDNLCYRRHDALFVGIAALAVITLLTLEHRHGLFI